MHQVTQVKDYRREKQMAHYSTSGLWTSERNHTPYEASMVECKDCFESVEDADDEFCNFCGDPLCLDCQKVVNDEPLCSHCFSTLAEVALASLQRDPQVGDLFGMPAQNSFMPPSR